MPQNLQVQPNSNQTLIELIYALKNLAQQVEFYHHDLSRRIEEETRSRQDGTMSLSNRMERMLERVESEMETKLDDVSSAIEAVRYALQEHSRVSDIAIAKVEAIKDYDDKDQEDKRDVTGRIEVTNEGDVRVLLNQSVLKKAWYGIIAVATSGGAYGFVKMIQHFLNG